jgi:hypothetical protein
MEQSPRLALSYVAPSQAQKHVTVNETFRRLDALVQLSVRSRSVSAEPGAPSEGDGYILPASPSGAAWDSYAEHDIAVFQDGAWVAVAPAEGVRAYVADEGIIVAFDGAIWTGRITETQKEAATFGVNASADATNKLAVKSDAVLLSHDDVTPGSGDARVKVNKAAAAGTASHLFQTGYSGRAEFGLTGDDHVRLKVSADGSAWNDALKADGATGTLYLPAGLRLGADAAANELADYETGIWTPALGGTKSGDLAAATGLTVAYAYYTKIGPLVTTQCGFDVTGLTAATFTQKSTIEITGLPFAPRNEGGNIDMGGVSGFVYRSIGSALDSMLGGGVGSTGSLYLFVFYTGFGEARNTDRFHVCAAYHTDD